MNADTGRVVPTYQIPPEERDDRKLWSEPFRKNEIVLVKGLPFRIWRFKRDGRLILTLVKGDERKKWEAEDALQKVEHEPQGKS